MLFNKDFYFYCNIIIGSLPLTILILILLSYLALLKNEFFLLKLSSLSYAKLPSKESKLLILFIINEEISFPFNIGLLGKIKGLFLLFI